MVSIGTELRIGMVLRGLTGRDVARRAGVSPFELSRIVNGRKSADPVVLSRIRAAIFTDNPERAA